MRTNTNELERIRRALLEIENAAMRMRYAGTHRAMPELRDQIEGTLARDQASIAEQCAALTHLLIGPP